MCVRLQANSELRYSDDYGTFDGLYMKSSSVKRNWTSKDECGCLYLIWPALFLIFLSTWPCAGLAGPASLELYGTLDSIGITVELDPNEDPEKNASASVQYRSGSEQYHPGLPLSRIPESHRLAGSLFWLNPGTRYYVRLTISDPDSGSLNDTVLERSAVTRSEISISRPDKALYASPGGTGDACTESAPCALQTGLSRVNAGEELVLAGGIYYRDKSVDAFRLEASGQPGRPILIRGKDGETAILDGADPDSSKLTWIAQGDGVWKATYKGSMDRTSMVLAYGKRLYPYRTLADLESLSYGISGFYAQDTELYVHLIDGAHPATAGLLISQHGCGLKIYEKHYAYIQNLTFRNYGDAHRAQALRFVNATHNLVQNCIFENNDIDIDLAGDSQNNLIQENAFLDSVFGWPWGAIKNEYYNEIRELEGGAIFIELKEAYGITYGNPRGNVVRRNEFTGYFDGIHVASADESQLRVVDLDICENQFMEIADDAIQVDGYASNLRIYKNTMGTILNGVSLAPLYDGPVYAVRNLMYGIGSGNHEHESGTPFKFQNKNEHTYGAIYLLHNTCDGGRVLETSDGLMILKQKDGSDYRLSQLYSRNNIWVGARRALIKLNTSPTGVFDLDHDNLYARNGAQLLMWDYNGYYNLSDFQYATGLEFHGLNADPGFVDTMHGDYSLAANSKMIDKGIHIWGINDEYAGQAPDIGFAESPEGGPKPQEPGKVMPWLLFLIAN